MTQQNVVSPSGEPWMPAALAAAILRAQKAARAVEKTAFNTHHKYAYASSEHIIYEAREAMGEAGLGVFATEWAVIQREAGQWMSVSYQLLCETGQSVICVTETAIVPDKGRPQDKAEATALTYSLAYFLRSLLLLPRVEAGTEVDQRPPAQAQEAAWKGLASPANVAANSAAVAPPRPAPAPPPPPAAPLPSPLVPTAASAPAQVIGESPVWIAFAASCKAAQDAQDTQALAAAYAQVRSAYDAGTIPLSVRDLAYQWTQSARALIVPMKAPVVA